MNHTNTDSQSTNINNTNNTRESILNLPPLRVRSVTVNNSLRNQWQQRIGRPINDSAFVSDQQRRYLLAFLVIISAIFLTISIWHGPSTTTSTTTTTHHSSSSISHFIR